LASDNAGEEMAESHLDRLKQIISQWRFMQSDD
jgi:hypothetical protein